MSIVSIFIINSTTSQITVSFVGDILLDRGVRKAIEEKGYDYPYEIVKNIFKKDDITFGNLECPILTKGKAVYKRPELIFKADPQNASALKKAGFDILNIANNHTMDYGSEGLLSTIDILKENNIKTVGGSRNYNTARKPVYIRKKGNTIGFLGYSVFPPEGYIVSSNRPDVARVDYDKISSEIKMAKEKCDFLVVSFHWGNEYDFFPSERQKELAHKVVESGADLVIGHHPHVLQGVEKYKDKYIFYSLGNFVFDRQIQKGTNETIITKVDIQDNKIKNIKLIPIKIIDCQPRIAKGKDAEYIIERLKLYSQDMNADIIFQDGVGYVKNVNK